MATFYVISATNLLATFLCDAFFFGIYLDWLIWDELTFDLGRIQFFMRPGCLEYVPWVCPSSFTCPVYLSRTYKRLSVFLNLEHALI